jgi:hypothetical protein
VVTAVEIEGLFVSFFYRIYNLCNTGFRSSIISLNSDSEICTNPLINICAAKGKQSKKDIHQSCLGFKVLLFQLQFPFQFVQLVR